MEHPSGFCHQLGSQRKSRFKNFISKQVPLGQDVYLWIFPPVDAGLAPWNVEGDVGRDVLKLRHHELECQPGEGLGEAPHEVGTLREGPQNTLEINNLKRQRIQAL